jgi:epoxide hydrolase-like predicted phosphatase
LVAHFASSQQLSVPNLTEHRLIPPHIRNLIFDLGGVILNLSVPYTLNQLASLTGLSLEKIMESYSSREEFLQYEKGLITEPAFRSALRKIYSFEGTDDAIDKCWNAMLLDIPPSRIAQLRTLKTRYRTFLLSNTNAIHVKCFSERLSKDHGLASLDDLFEKVYYSHLLNMRKPDPEIYRHVLKENNLNPSETLFLDDSAKNIEGAKSVGIETMLVTSADQLFASLR